MRHYEIIFLIHPDQKDQINHMLNRYRSTVETGGGHIHRLEIWGRMMLAYPINKIHKAFYVLTNIECHSEVLDEIKRSFQFNDAVLRHLIIRRDEAITTPSIIMQEKEKADAAEKAAAAVSAQPKPDDSADKPAAAKETDADTGTDAGASAADNNVTPPAATTAADASTSSGAASADKPATDQAATPAAITKETPAVDAKAQEKADEAQPAPVAPAVSSAAADAPAETPAAAPKAPAVPAPASPAATPAAAARPPAPTKPQPPTTTPQPDAAATDENKGGLAGGITKLVKGIFGSDGEEKDGKKKEDADK